MADQLNICASQQQGLFEKQHKLFKKKHDPKGNTGQSVAHQLVP